jgi:16S rRNA (cytidine1402-2'-O)-methyltransferase
MSGTLYLIPVALGDVAWTEFLPQRTRDIACSLSHFAVENAKTARAELKRIGHPLPLRELAIEQLAEKLDPQKIDGMLAPLSKGHDLGLMSEAGCPGVADPGALLVKRAHELGIRVVPLVGPSSILLALMASGFNGQQFAFQGYLPARDPERSAKIAELEKESQRLNQTQIFIETPYRNEAMFESLLKTCKPATRLCIASNVTLVDEHISTRRIAEWRSATQPSLHHRPTVFLFSAS